jgi:DNA polymerase
MSTQKFKEALEALGVTVETKTSLRTGKETPAFAKTDEFMAGLLDHEDPAVQALAAARLGFKSTLEETRCAKLLSIAELDWGFIK